MSLFRKHTYVILFLLVAIGLASCHRKPRIDELSDASACYVAELYYRYLAEEKVDKYVSFIGSSEGMPEGYRSQMEDLMKQYLMNVRQSRGGILKAQAAGDSIWGHEAQVFLDVLYGDSTSERVDMLLFFENKQWRIH